VADIFESLENYKSNYFYSLNVNQKRNIADKKIYFQKLFIACQ